MSLVPANLPREHPEDFDIPVVVSPMEGLVLRAGNGEVAVTFEGTATPLISERRGEAYGTLMAHRFAEAHATLRRWRKQEHSPTLQELQLIAPMIYTLFYPHIEVEKGTPPCPPTPAPEARPSHPLAPTTLRPER